MVDSRSEQRANKVVPRYKAHLIYGTLDVDLRFLDDFAC